VQVHVGVCAGELDIESAFQLARSAQRGLLDFIMSDDLTVLAALAGVTDHLGLVGVIDTTSTEPFEVARQLATLDHLSDGRAGWSVTAAAAADEFVAVVRKFWDSWEPDAVLADLDTGIYADPNKIRSVEHTGAQFTARGMATLPAGPHGEPVLVQQDVFTAGGGVILSPDGLDDFVDREVPLLQKRGEFRTEYRGTTLRANLGLA
jgi:alkanesulfonate monooxygenase SsuD/methylene tetrahydromethanopterin reductase-like flavin-dependent oxidoreductase (luciferase family)